MKFRKKPVLIEAEKFNSANWRNILEFIGEKSGYIKTDEMILIIHTLEGDMRAVPGDWIIKGVSGEFYPCKPDIFEKTYEKVK
jgi:hypothetical protein